MSERFLNDRIELHCGDCRDVLATLPEDSLDACVTDPPYHLTSIVKRFGKTSLADDTITSQRVRDRADGYARLNGGGGFMGKVWDGGEVAFRPETWAAVYRVLKPGAHLIAMGGTRTYHRMACAIEDAGFEIRDTVSWLYGSGFPKSHDVSKGIDKRRDEDDAPIRVICRFIRAAMDAQGIKSHELIQYFDDCHPRLIDHWAARDTDSQPSLPTWPQWLKLKEVLGLSDIHDVEVWRLNERKGEPSDNWKTAPILGEHDGEPGGFGEHRFSVRDKLIRSATDVAREWQGWGTALKPACELIVLARKPLSEGTGAANVLRWGTGAINVDGCRVASEERLPVTGFANRNLLKRNAQASDRPWMIAADPDESGAVQPNPLGRWPANVVHDGSDEVVAAFPETHAAGTCSARPDRGPFSNGTESLIGRDIPNDSGSAARFFYTAKADADDRLGSKHPTVKPLDLMQWLVRLITPPKGIVLDCFAGTGTTGEAAWREGMSAVLIEAEAEYQADIRRRMALALVGPDERARESIKARNLPRDDGPLFAVQQAQSVQSESWAEMWAKPFDFSQEPRE